MTMYFISGINDMLIRDNDDRRWYVHNFADNIVRDVKPSPIWTQLKGNAWRNKGKRRKTDPNRKVINAARNANVRRQRRGQ